MSKVEFRLIENEHWFKFNSKFDKFKYFYGHWVSIILFIVVIGLIIWLGIFLFQNKTAFLENPLAHGITQMEKKLEGEISCSCFITGDNFASVPFMLDREGIHSTQQQKTDLDLSNFTW